MFSKHGRVLLRRLQDVQAATVRLNSAMQAQLTTPGHGYSGDTTQHHSVGPVQCSRAIRQDVSTLLTPYKTSFATPSHYDPRCCIGFQPPRGHLSDPGSHCNYSAFSYKRIR
jgi:hypothetical protein